MADNNPVSQTPPVPVNQPTMSTPVSNPPAGDPKRLIVWFIMGLLAVALLVGGTYVFLSKQSATIPTSQPIVSQQTRTQSLEVPQENLESDISNLNVDDASSDFSSVDQDLSQL